MQTNDNVLSVYRLDDINEVKALPAVLDQLKRSSQVHISRRRVPAVAGELAGMATDLFLSPPVQALANAAELGTLLWATINCLKSAGKYLRLGKNGVTLLAASKAKRELAETGGSLADGVVWGPMDAELISGFSGKSGFDRDGQTPTAYFIAIAVPRPKQRVRTLYYVVGADGEIFGSWSTQTFRNRTPEFLRPKPTRKRKGRRPKNR